jgi:hypothetical protein
VHAWQATNPGQLRRIEHPAQAGRSRFPGKPMFSVVYVSSAVKPFAQAQLLELLAGSRAANAQLGVSGMLLYKCGNFMQVLEGEESVVRRLLARIGADTRHRGVLVLLQQQQESRDFPEWSMGFRDLDSPEVRALAAYCEFMNLDLRDEHFFSDPSNAQKLLLTFKKAMR